MKQEFHVNMGNGDQVGIPDLEDNQLTAIFRSLMVRLVAQGSVEKRVLLALDSESECGIGEMMAESFQMLGEVQFFLDKIAAEIRSRKIECKCSNFKLIVN